MNQHVCGHGEVETPPDAIARLPNAGSSGRNCAPAFMRETQGDPPRPPGIEFDLARAMAGGELQLAWQPVVDGVTGSTVCTEALLRWTRGKLGAVSPQQFVPLAEQAGLIDILGGWTMSRACRQAAQWRRNVAPELRVAVNVSALQINGHFARQVARVLESSGLEPSALELEITESRLLPDTPSVHSAMAKVADFGVKWLIDDFGTGYASLAYLTRFAWHGLKIDRSLVAGLPDDKRAAIIVDGLVKIARGIGLGVTAEGVETQGQAVFLRACGVDRMQGFLFSRPLAPGAFVRHYGQRAGRGESARDLGQDSSTY